MKKWKRWMKNRIFAAAALAGLAVIFVVALFAVERNFRHYEEKLEILSIMLEPGTEDQQLDKAIVLLKGQEHTTDGTKGNEILESFGYFKNGGNIYARELKGDILVIVLLAAGGYIVYLLALMGACEAMRVRSQEELKRIGALLEHFQRQKYQVDIPVENRNPETEKIYGQIESLCEVLKINEERMSWEKEGTKALVTDISHQLKTPVAALKACFEILQQENLKPQERAEFSERCSSQLAGLEELLAALLNISRMETGNIEVQKVKADIFETLVQAVSRVYIKAQEKHIDIEMEEECTDGIELPHDVKWTCEAFINLLENAVKYSPHHTVILIRMIKRTSFLRIEIEDEGIGVPREEYHKIFKRFYRGEAKEVQKTEGSGVGLYLTREIISRQGGSITVNSRCGKEKTGSTFVIQLPYVM